MGDERPGVALADEVAADLEVLLPREVGGVAVCGQAGATLRQRHPGGPVAQGDSLHRRLGDHGYTGRERESVGSDPGQHGILVAVAELADPLVPYARPTLGWSEWLGWLLDVAGAHLLLVRVDHLRGLGVITVGPEEDTLGPDLHVEARVVPVEDPAQRLRGMHVLGHRQLLAGLAPVALAVGDQVAVVDLGRALDEHPAALVDPRARRIGEEQADPRVGAGVICLLRIAESRRDVDRLGAVVVIGGHRPGDRLLIGVDRRVLAGDVAGEGLADLVRERCGHLMQMRSSRTGCEAEDSAFFISARIPRLASR
jgi:hypothetical protein